MPALRAVVAVLLTTGGLLAQWARPDRFELAPTLKALRAQVRATADADRTVAGSAWLVRAFVAAGSTMRTGTCRAEIKTLVNWFRNAQDGDGRIAPGGTPCPRVDQMLAATALVEACTVSNYALLKATSRRAALAATTAFEVENATPATGDEAALLVVFANILDEAGEPGLAARARAAAKPVAEARTAAVTRREDAVRMLVRTALGATEAPDLIAAVVWPPDLAADPLHAFFAVQALLPHRAQLARFADPLQRLARVRAAPRGDGALWPAAPGLDAVTTTAMLVTVLGQSASFLPQGDADERADADQPAFR